MNDQTVIKIHQKLRARILKDLSRRHSYASERVGFLSTKSQKGKDGKTIILAKDYYAIGDENYIKDDSVGARINSIAIQNALQCILDNDVGLFHVHLHPHKSIPNMSPIDEEGIPPIIKSFQNLAPDEKHGILIFSKDKANGWITVNDQRSLDNAKKIVFVGDPIEQVLLHPKYEVIGSKKYQRQSFLGEGSEKIIKNTKVGIVGLGGGGSHIVQQLAYIGFLDWVIIDYDPFEEHNFHRHIGAQNKDIENEPLKIDIAKRLIFSINPNAEVEAFDDDWKDRTNELSQCDIIFGCVDSYSARRSIEAFTRRYLIPYLDIGMDVHQQGSESPRMAGQVILSMPGQPCFKCLGFLDKNNLKKEGENYGDAGGNPQVIWANGVLASNAVGIAMDLLTNWTRNKTNPYFISYDGNKNTLEEDVRLKFNSEESCSHYSLKEIGPNKL